MVIFTRPPFYVFVRKTGCLHLISCRTVEIGDSMLIFTHPRNFSMIVWVVKGYVELFRILTIGEELLQICKARLLLGVWEGFKIPWKYKSRAMYRGLWVPQECGR